MNAECCTQLFSACWLRHILLYVSTVSGVGTCPFTSEAVFSAFTVNTKHFNLIHVLYSLYHMVVV